MAVVKGQIVALVKVVEKTVAREITVVPVRNVVSEGIVPAALRLVVTDLTAALVMVVVENRIVQARIVEQMDVLDRTVAQVLDVRMIVKIHRAVQDRTVVQDQVVQMIVKTHHAVQGTTVV